MSIPLPFHHVKPSSLKAFKSLPGVWELNWTDGVSPKRGTPGRYMVMAEMRRVNERAPKFVPVELTAAALLPIGGRWKDGTLQGITGMQQTFRPILARQSVWFHPLPGRTNAYLPKQARPIFGGVHAGSLTAYETHEGPVLLMPDWAIFQFYYGFTGAMVVSAFCGNEFERPDVQRHIPHVPDRTDWVDEKKTIYQICRKREVSQSEICRYARTVLTNEGLQTRQQLLNWAIAGAQRSVHQGQPLPQLKPPVEGAFRWIVLGQPLPLWEGREAFLVNYLVYHDGPMPFDQLLVDALNDAHPGQNVAATPKSAWVGPQIVPVAGGALPTVSGGPEEPGFVRSELEAVLGGDLGAERVSISPAPKSLQRYKSSGTIVKGDPRDEFTVEPGGRGGDPGARAVRSQTGGSSEPLTTSDMNQVIVRAFDLLVARVKPPAMARWYPLVHHHCVLPKDEHVGRRHPFYFVVVRVVREEQTTYAIDQLRQRTSDRSAIIIIRRVDGVEMDEMQFARLFEKFYEGRRDRTAWYTALSLSDFTIRRVCHPARSDRHPAQTLASRLATGFNVGLNMKGAYDAQERNQA